MAQRSSGRLATLQAFYQHDARENTQFGVLWVFFFKDPCLEQKYKSIPNKTIPVKPNVRSKLS